MVRPWKNSRVTDAQRARNSRRKVMEERGLAEDIWQTTEPTTDAERGLDYLHYRRYEVERRRLEKQGKKGMVYVDRNIGVRRDDHITSRTLCGVLWPNAFNQGRFPLNEAEENRDKLGRTAVAALLGEIRRNQEYGMLAILSDILHEDPDTKDLENVIFDGRTEKKKKGREKLEDFPKDHPIKIWLKRKSNIRNTQAQSVQLTLENFLRSEMEAIAFERAEADRRRRKRQGGGGGGGGIT